MKLVEFPEMTAVIAKDQPQYMPMPAHVGRSNEGRVTFCWSLSWRERWSLFFSGVLWHQVLTFRRPLQPQLLLVDKPALV
jgi:hypothetical protein